MQYVAKITSYYKNDGNLVIIFDISYRKKHV